jgi:CRISPR-associated Cas5-like protein
MLSQPVCLLVKGPFACFTRPEFHVERVSCPVIAPSAARSIFSLGSDRIWPTGVATLSA